MRTLGKSFLFVVFVGATLSVIYSFTAGSPATTPSVHAQGSTGLSGWAWSETIGWICFNNASCTTATVSADAGGNLTGYAWSEYIGWIQFGGLSGFPTGSGTTAANARIQSGALTGWIKAVGASGGWDGWIALSGTGYGPTLSGTSLSGYAWGSDVVGWVYFNGVAYTSSTPPSCTITNTGPYEPSTAGTFTYTSANATAGSIGSGVGSVSPVAGGTKAFTAPASVGVYNYALTVNNAGLATSTCSTDVSVENAPPPPPPASSINTFYASPSRVRNNGTEYSTLYWRITNFDASYSCGITGTDGSIYPIFPANASSSQQTDPITKITSFTLACTGGATPVTRTIQIVPSIQEI